VLNIKRNKKKVKSERVQESKGKMVVCVGK